MRRIGADRAADELDTAAVAKALTTGAPHDDDDAARDNIRERSIDMIICSVGICRQRQE